MAKDNNGGTLPRHIAIIMDGNGRWAKKRLLPRTAGHSAGGETFVSTVDECLKLGIECLTVYALSTENWSRSTEEIGGLMKLLATYMKKYVPELEKKNVRLRFIGDLSRFDDKMRTDLEASEKRLENCTGMTLCVALSYGGRNEIVEAAKRLIKKGNTDITEADFSNELYTAGIPDPDLIIRTGGEKRVSNFLLWQCAYSEFYFTDVLWPDFKAANLAEAVESFKTRKRRYGKEE